MAYGGVPGVHLKKPWYKALVHEDVAPDLLKNNSARVWVLSKEMEKNEEEKEEMEGLERMLLTFFATSDYCRPPTRPYGPPQTC